MAAPAKSAIAAAVEARAARATRATSGGVARKRTVGHVEPAAEVVDRAAGPGAAWLLWV